MGIAIDKLSNIDLEKYIHISATISRQEAAAAKTRSVRAYYDGDHPVMLTQRQQEYLGPLLTEGEFEFSHNAVKSVVDLVKDRLRVEGFTVNGQDAGDIDDKESASNPAATAAAQMWQWWNDWRMNAQQSRLYKRTLRDGYSYVMVDYDNANQRPRATLHSLDDGTTGIVYHRDPDDPNVVLFATKYWTAYDPLTPGTAGKQRKTVYLPHEIRKYTKDNLPAGWRQIQDDGDAGWPIPWRDRQGKPLGVPIIEFQDPDAGIVGSIIGLQNALNKAWLDLLAAADASGFPVLVVEYEGPEPSPGGVEDDANIMGTDENRIGPGRAFEVFDGKIKRIEGADMSQMIQVIWTITAAIAAVSRVPQHELKPLAGIDFPSGEALKQAESGLVTKVEERQMVFGQSWADVLAMGRKLEDAFGNRLPVLAQTNIAVQWKDANSRMVKTDAEVAQIFKGLGVPDSAVFAKAGYSPEQIVAFQKEARLEESAKVAAIAGVLRANQTSQAPQTQPATFTNGSGVGNGRV